MTDKSSLTREKLKRAKAKYNKYADRLEETSIEFMETCYKIFDFQIKVNPKNDELYEYRNKFNLIHGAHNKDYIIQMIGPKLFSNKDEIDRLDKDRFEDINKIFQQAETLLNAKNVKRKVVDKTCQVINSAFSEYRNLEEKDRVVVHDLIKKLLRLYDDYTTNSAQVQFHDAKMKELRSQL
jgi:hypothetical protein